MNKSAEAGVRPESEGGRSRWRGSLDQAIDLHEIGLGNERELFHVCLGLDLRKLATAKDLMRNGLVVVEDSPEGPMVTRTWRGTKTLSRVRAGSST